MKKLWKLILFELLLVVVVVAVWFLAPLVGITSVLWRLLIILVLILPPIALVVYNFIVARKGAKGLEAELRKQGQQQKDSVRPDRREEIGALNDAFGDAIAAIKRSKLGGRGSTALYALPWYMIIGPPGAGKSTALRRSGLKFPFSTGEKKAVKGVGGTRNCDWWFSDKAILLDTAGRYTLADEDQEEWQAFLRMLKKYRKKRPLNGLIVAVSVADLMTINREEINNLASQIRNRVDQVIKLLEVSLPVYVLFTKCDLIAGFVEFFGDLKRSTRTQVLGFTLPLSDAPDEIEEVFQEEFELLADRLQQRMLHRLGAAKTHRRSEIFQFPLQFASVKEALGRFIANLMVVNPYLDTPKVRGFYFCSGTQEGRPVDKVMVAMSQALGLRKQVTGGGEEKTTTKSYFLRDVFTEVIFPDRDLAGTTASGITRRRRLALGALAACALVSAGVAGLSTMTFSNNRTLVKSSVELAKTARPSSHEDPRRVLGSLRRLEKLGARLDTLYEHKEDGVPWSMGLGFYQGHNLRPDLERVYHKRMRQEFVYPAGKELEGTLIDIGSTSSSSSSSSSGAAKDFQLLKTYLMVTDPKRLEIKFASQMLLEQWKKQLHPEVAKEREMLLRGARRFLSAVKAGRARWLARDKGVVDSVRQTLRARDAEYRHVIADAEQQLRPVTLRDTLGGRVQTVIKAQHSVHGAYSREGWERYMRAKIATQMVSSSKIEPWVLGEEGSTTAAERLRKRYFGQYILEWKRFIKGLTLEPTASAKDSLRALEIMTEEPKLLQLIFSSVVRHTQLPMMDTAKAKKLLGSKLKVLGKAKKAGIDVDKTLAKRSMTPVEKAFAPLRELVAPPEGADGSPQISGLKQYLDQLNNVRDALSKVVGGKAEPGEFEKVIEESRRVTKGILATLPGNFRRLLGPLFYAPLEGAGSNAGVEQANQTSQSFSDQLCGPFNDKLAKCYPFTPKASCDALVQDVVEFFAPSSGSAWTHFESNLKTRLLRKGETFEADSSGNVPPQVVSFYNKVNLITKALFPMGSASPRLRFQVRPSPAVIADGATYQVSEISLEVEGKTKVYRNGPMEQWSFEWTGKEQRARLLVRGAGGLREELKYEGSWSLLRLVNDGKSAKRGSWYRVEWPFKKGKLRIKIDFKPLRSNNPLFQSMKLSCKSG